MRGRLASLIVLSHVFLIIRQSAKLRSDGGWEDEEFKIVIKS